MEKQGNDLQASNASDSSGMDKVFVFNCPYLGTPEDSDTSLAYPASANHCFRTDTPISVDLTHQETYCLTDQHSNCHVFQMASAATVEAEVDEEQSAPREKGKRRLSLYALPLILVLILLAAIVWWPAPGTTIQESLARGDQPKEETRGGVTLTGKSVSEQATTDDPVEIAAPETVAEASAGAALNDSPAEEKSANKTQSSVESDAKNEPGSASAEASSATITDTNSASSTSAATATESEEESTSVEVEQTEKAVFVETEVVNKETAALEEAETDAAETSSVAKDTASADEDPTASEIEEISATANDLETEPQTIESEETDEVPTVVTTDLPVISTDAVAVSAAPVETIGMSDAGESVIMVGPVASTALTLDDVSEEINPLIVYESSAADGAILSLIESRQFVTFLGRDKSGAWLNIRLADGLEGWVNANQSGANLDTSSAPVETVQNRPAASSYPVIRYAYVDTGALNLRTGPGVEYEPFTIINKGEIVGLIGRRSLGPWVRVRLDDGSEGWVNSSLLAPVS